MHEPWDSLHPAWAMGHGHGLGGGGGGGGVLAFINF